MRSDVLQRMLDAEVQNSQTAWAEAQRINDMWVAADARGAVLTEMLDKEVENSKAAWAEAQRLQAVLNLRGAGLPREPVVLATENGTIMPGSWSQKHPFDEELETSAKFLAATSRGRDLGFDGAVLLMLPGWDDEMRGNRWHVINFLSARMPVLVVQPCLLPTATVAGPHIRRDRCFKGVWILETHYHTRRAADDVSEPMLHVRDIRWAMRRLGISRPLYWCFSPYLAQALTGLGDGYRLIHATEDWIQFPGLPAVARHHYEEALGYADQIVAVSSGVAEAMRRVRPNVEIEVVTNGCQYLAYASADPHPEVVRIRDRHGGRAAIFAGNIDNRLDYRLIRRIAEEIDDLSICFVGPVGSQSPEDQSDWESTIQLDRVSWLGRMDPAALPSLYHAADVGIVPYKHEDHIVHSNFSLKVLEMGAAGLPVVTTLMKWIVDLADAIKVCADREEFIRTLKSTSRATMTAAERRQLDEVARRNDYETKFDEVLARAANRFSAGDFRPAVAWSEADSADWIAVWSTSPLAVGDRGRLVRAARRLRTRLGRGHKTSRLALARLGYHLSATKPAFGMRLLAASLTNVGDFECYQSGVMMAGLLCKLAGANGRFDIAVLSGDAAWGVARGEGLSHEFIVEFGLDYAEALSRRADAERALKVAKEVEAMGGLDQQAQSRIARLRAEGA